MNNQAYAFDIELDNDNFYINTVLKDKQWIPVIGRKASVGDDDFFVFVAKSAKKHRDYVYIMPMLGSEASFKEVFRGEDELSNFVVNTLIKLKTSAIISSDLTGETDSLHLTADKPLNGKPAIVKIAGEDANDYDTEMQKILEIQDKTGTFLQRI